MILKEKIIGKHINLRSVLEEDANFIINLRSNSSLNTFVHDIGTDIVEQQNWIRNQQKIDYYFIIERITDSAPIGTISAYNFDENLNKTEWGRWISKGNPLENFESAYLIYDFIFNTLKFNSAFGMVDSRNKKIVNFHKKFGCTISDKIVKVDNFELQEHILDKYTFEEKTPFYKSMINLTSC